jgi:hypothetical protein
MAKKDLRKIFLSASIPLPERDPLFYDTADIIAIRDSVRALATVVIPKVHLIFGGHPSITPLIEYVVTKMGSDVNKHFTVYQSLWFKNQFPEENKRFNNIILTPKLSTEKASINLLRTKMIVDNNFYAGVFIGGMEGVKDEFNLFSSTHSNALILPVASTGAASKLLYGQMQNQLDERLNNDYAYMNLFRELLKI